MIRGLSEYSLTEPTTLILTLYLITQQSVILICVVPGIPVSLYPEMQYIVQGIA